MRAAALKSSDVLAQRIVVVRRERLRWLSLAYLDAARPGLMMDSALLPLVQLDYPDTSTAELRLALDYLALRGLLTHADVAGLWQLRLTYHGIDLVEYTSDCAPGIARPQDVKG